MHGVAKRWWSLVKAVTKRDFRQVLSGGSSQNLQTLVPEHSGLCLLVQMVDGCCHRFSHLSCSCPSCLSLGEALSGRWVDLSFSLCGRSACVSLYFLGIVERSQAGHLGTGASGRQTPQAPGTSTTFSPFSQGSRRCAKIAPPMVKPVKRRSLVQ